MTPSKKPTEAGFRALLGNRSFTWLWAGQILSQVTDKILVVLAVSLLDKYYKLPASWDGSSESAIMVINTIPAIIFGVAAGVMADRYPKKQVMVVSNILRAALIPLIILLPQQFALMLLVIFAVSTVTQFFTPAEQSIIPLVVKPHHLLMANALFAITQLASIQGFAIGEPLLFIVNQYFGVTGKILVLAAFYLLAAFCCQMIKCEEILPKRTFGKNLNPLPELQEGLRYLQGNRPVLDAIVQITIIYSIIAALQVLSIQLGKDIGLKKEQFGFLIAATGVGLVIGAGILSQWGNRLRSRPLPLIGFSMVPLVMIGYVLFKALVPALLLSVVLGFGAALVILPIRTLIQENTPESVRGKVFGFENNVENIALSLPLALAGPAAKYCGLDLVLIVMAGAVTLTTIWVHRNNLKMVSDVT
jgi:predicted MFS family arabinose efflux permease